MTEVEIVSFSAMQVKSKWIMQAFLKHDVRVSERQVEEGESIAKITRRSASFTGSASGSVGVVTETGVGVWVVGLDSTNKLSVTITGW